MNLDLFVKKTANLYAENRLLKFVITVLTIAVIINSYFSYRALHYQKVIILPPVVDKRIEITGNQVNDAYIRLFVRYAMTLLANYQPETVESQFEEFLTLVTPSAYPEVEKVLSDLEGTVKKLDLSSVFYPQDVQIDRKKHTITVIGREKKTSKDVVVESGPKKYVLKYKIINARFYIDGIKEENVRQ